MIEIRSAAAMGFDRAVSAMRRKNGGREESDSGWRELGFDGDEFEYEFAFGEKDMQECERLLHGREWGFLRFVALWAVIEAPAKWWDKYGAWFVASDDVKRTGDSVAKSILTTYSAMHCLLREAYAAGRNAQKELEEWRELRGAVMNLPECWLLLSGMEEGRPEQ